MSTPEQQQNFQQHAGINALINYSVICAKQCNVLKGNDDALTDKNKDCLVQCAQQVRNSFQYSKSVYGNH